MGKFSKAIRGILLLAIILPAILILIPSVTHATVADQAQVQADRADVLMKQGQFTAASTEWRKVLTDYEGTDAQLGMVKASALIWVGGSATAVGAVGRCPRQFRKSLDRLLTVSFPMRGRDVMQR